MANVTPPKSWASPLRQITVSINARSADKTTWSVVWRTADKGDAKDVRAILADGEWPKGIDTREDAVRALGAIASQLWHTFLAEE